jgi:hypothetical protein
VSVRPLVLAAVAMAVAPGDARAQPWTIPVYVSVVGSGVVRVSVAAGNVVPCDSSTNVPLFDGRMSAGTTTVLASPYGCICERHTHGAFREVDFTTPQIWCQQIDVRTGLYRPYIAIALSTD